MTDDDESSGTSAHGVALAVSELTNGRLAAHPVRGLDASGVRALLRAAAETSAPAVLIANVQTGAFWGSHPTAAQLAALPRAAAISARGRRPTGASGTSSASSASARAGQARS